MFREERHKYILSELKKNNRIKVDELSKKFKVSQATIRRDLSKLENLGLLIRTHGGAIYPESNLAEPTNKEKQNKYNKEKKAIGKKAAQYIQDGETILLNGGTTTLQIINYIDSQYNLSILTNNLEIINKLEQMKTNWTCIVIGGLLKRNTGAVVGPLAGELIEKFRVDKAFIGTNGLTVEDGATTSNIFEARLKQKMIAISREVYLVFDHSKFGSVSFSKFMEADSIDNIITDKIPETFRDKLSKFKINIISIENNLKKGVGEKKT